MGQMNLRHLRPDDLVGRRWRGLVRESTERQAEAWSPDRQRADIRRAADELGMLPAEPLFYERTGSGEKEGVPEVRRALEDGRRGEYDVLVVFTTSRFARNATEARVMKREFARAGIVIYFAHDRMISGARSSRLTEGIKEVIDEEENEVRRMWVAGGMRERQLSGRWMGRTPYGYRKALVDFPDGSRAWDGGLELDPETAPVVRRIFTSLAGGTPPIRVAINLNVDGIRRPNGKPWTTAAIWNVVKNPVHTGRLVRYARGRAPHYYNAEDPHDGRREVGRPFPAIVDDATWDAAQPSGTGTMWQTKRAYPLSRIMRCGKCGFRMQGSHSARHRYYRCGGRLVGACDARLIRADKAEAAFADFLEEGLRLPDDWRETLSKLHVRAIASDDRERSRKIDERLARLKNLYAWGDIPEDEYRDEVGRLKAEQAVVVMPDLSGIEKIAEALRDVGAAWRSIPEDRKQELPSRILQQIVVTDAEITAFVARPELKPLLDLGVVAAASASTRRSNYTVRFSA
jgi:site-specific DNA recombinase